MQIRPKPSPSEVVALRSLDRAFRVHHQEKDKPASGEPVSLTEGLKAVAQKHAAKKKGGKKNG